MSDVTPPRYSDSEAAAALANLLGESDWEAVALAHGYLALTSGASDDDAARTTFVRGYTPLARCRQIVPALKAQGFLHLLKARIRTGSAENPITKLFPGFITEERFFEILEDLSRIRPGLTYSDDRKSGHTLSDVTIHEDDLALPINIKAANTRFEKSLDLVGIEPDDCLPIPAYKAYGAIERKPELLYVVSADYSLTSVVASTLPKILNPQENIIWHILTNYVGSGVRKAEDAFIYRIVRKHWDTFKAVVANAPFRAISAKKAVRILHTIPKRTPGIGLRAWGTGASAEVNVHVSIKGDTKHWDEISARIQTKGLSDIIYAINRQRTELISDPEI